MGKIENDEVRKRKNNHFIQAFEYVANCLSMTQGQLAKSIGSKTAYISNFRNGLRPVPEDTIEGLIRISATKPGLQIFSEYLYGNSDIMLLSNVTDEEMNAAIARRNNPDYQTLEEKTADNNLSLSDKLIASLEKQVKDKDDQLKDKERYIKLLEEKIEMLEAMQHLESPIDKYPFAIGTAESKRI